jgi:hypothetical protein
MASSLISTSMLFGGTFIILTRVLMLSVRAVIAVTESDR